MTADEAVRKLNAEVMNDQECAHIEADRIICEFLRSSPDGARVAQAWDDLRTAVGGFWYA